MANKFNDIDMQDWKNCDINIDTLWLIDRRDKSGKHKNIYHGNFIPQIPNQLIRRYTKENEIIIDPFLGSGTTLYECDNLKRKLIGLDINEKVLEFTLDNMGNNFNNKHFYITVCDNTNSKSLKYINEGLKSLKSKTAQFVIFHPPYMDIIKFTDKKEDLSQINNMDDFLNAFLKTCKNILPFLDKDRYFAIVIGDIYRNSEVKPLSFNVMNLIQNNFKVKLKGIIIKNIEGNRGKLKTENIWRYRALKSDYYIFKHEYIFVFKKEF